MKMDKKGLGTGLVLFFAIIFIGLFIFMFFNSFDYSKVNAKKEIIKSVDMIDDNFVLVNYLKTPVDDGKTIADLIVDYDAKGVGKDKIEEETNEIFKNVYGDDVYWLLEINEKEIGYDGDGVALNIKQEAIIPSYENKILRIKLTIT